MTLKFRLVAPLALALMMSGCLGSLLGGGKTPATLLSLTPEAADPGAMTRSASAGDAVTVSPPIIAKELRTVRVPVQVTATDVAYVTNLQLVDTPDRLFKDLLSETIRRTTNRVVLDPKQSALDPGLVVNGEIHHFGFDTAQQAVIVQYDGALSTQGGTHVETRRFEARVPSTSDAASVGPALNHAANQVALEVAKWIGG